MNILILSWRGPGHPNAGGAEISTHEHAKGWVRMGHDVTLFTSCYEGGKKEEKIEGVNIIRHGDQLLGVHIHAIKWYLFDNHPKYDLVIDQFHGIPFLTPLYVRVRKLAFIHEVAKEVWIVNIWPNAFFKILAVLGMFLEPWVFRIFYQNMSFMTVSESTKKDLVDWGIPRQNITVVHNGVDRSFAKQLLVKEKVKALIFLGALNRDKGIEDALKIFSILNESSSDLQFWVVGKGDLPYLKKLRQKTEQLGIDRKVKFWGYVSEEKKFQLLARAHLLINPSIREGWGLVVIEAASVGTPAVGYNVPGLRDSILDGKTGILCNPNPKACSEVVLHLMSDQKKYQTLRQNCFKWAKQFNWQKSSKKSLLLIEKLINL